MKTYGVLSGVVLASLLAACSGSSDGTIEAPGGGSADHDGDGGALGSDGGTGDGGGKPGDTLTASATASVALAAGGTTSVAVTIARGGWDADVTVTTTGLPVGITADALTIAKGTSSASIVLRAAAAATASATPFEVATAGDGLVAKASSRVSIGKAAIDSSFGASGFLTMASTIEDFVIEDDGRIVLYTADRSSGVFELVGLDAAGTIDPSFGVKGIVSLPNGKSTFGALARQADGKLLVAYPPAVPVGSEQTVDVLRFDAHGGVDSSFGSAGISALNVGSCNQSNADGVELAVASDGKILVGTSIGCDDDSGDHAFQNIAVARVTTSGALDDSFGSAGLVTFVGSTSDTTFLDALHADDGSLIVMLDRRTDPGSDDAYVVWRYDLDGHTKDPAFSFAKRPMGWQSQPGKGYLWGQRDVDQNDRLSRILVTGAVDTGFGGGGTGSVPAPGFLQDDFVNGEDVRFGTTQSGSLWEAHWNEPKKGFELWAYSADGVRDMTYGSAGRVSVPFADGNRSFDRAVLGADGRLVILTGDNDGNDVLARFFP